MSEVGAQPAQQVENLRFRRHVETGGRLVEDDQLRVAGKRHRDDDALLLASGELVGVLARGRFRVRETHVCDQLADAALTLGPRLADAVHRHGLD